MAFMIPFFHGFLWEGDAVRSQSLRLTWSTERILEQCLS